MKRPTWATVIGIIGIILGLVGLLSSANTIVMPQILEFQKEMITEMQKNIEENEAPPEEAMNMFNKIWNMPGWFKTWSVVAGIIGLIISGFYIFASIGLLQVKKSAIKMFYWVVGICIGFTFLKGVIAVSALSFIGISLMVGGLIGIVIDVILLIVVATGDKQAFFAKEA